LTISYRPSFRDSAKNLTEWTASAPGPRFTGPLKPGRRRARLKVAPGKLSPNR
jgi:hypothetical protein